MNFFKATANIELMLYNFKLPLPHRAVQQYASLMDKHLRDIVDVRSKLTTFINGSFEAELSEVYGKALTETEQLLVKRLTIDMSPTDDQMTILRLQQDLLNGESNVILGISGVGKTTLAPLWQLLAKKLEKHLVISATSREAAAQINPEGKGTKYKVRFKGILRGQSMTDVSLEERMWAKINREPNK